MKLLGVVMVKILNTYNTCMYLRLFVYNCTYSSNDISHLHNIDVTLLLTNVAEYVRWRPNNGTMGAAATGPHWG